jgi:hypothetical protein
MKSLKTTEFFAKITHWAKQLGYRDIKANTEGFDVPSSFLLKSTDETIIPDVTAIHGKSKSYFEIVIKQDTRKDIRALVSKWKLMHSLAKHKGGQLYLVAPRGHKQFAQRIIAEYDLDAKFVSMSTLKTPPPLPPPTT